MSEKRSRILLALVGDIHHEPAARVKYGFFHAALERVYGSMDVFDTTLRGTARLVNSLRMFHPNPSIWRERFWKNVPAFRARSSLMNKRLLSSPGKIDIVLQLGVLFNAGLYQSNIPVVIYTDYTASLSAKRPEVGRSPFNELQRTEWLELERQSYAYAAHIFVRSELVRQSIIEDYAIDEDKVTVVGGGLNYAALPESTPRSNNEAPVILFIGKELYRKGGDVLLQAFAQARQIFPLVQLRLITQDPIPPGLSLDHVEVLQPTWERETIAKLFRAADLFVLPSRLETWGDVLLEAMAWGLPCIGVQGDAMNEIIVENKTGILIPSVDANALAEAMIRLLQQPSLRIEMGSAGRRRVEMEFTWDRVVARMAEVFDRIKL
jgi:glycosyltransferase involved in cell wall biosynthesis